MTKIFDYEKQEKLVAALYAFQEKNISMKHNCTWIASNGKECTINVSAVGEALDEIMAVFGYEVINTD